MCNAIIPVRRRSIFPSSSPTIRACVMWMPLFLHNIFLSEPYKRYICIRINIRVGRVFDRRRRRCGSRRRRRTSSRSSYRAEQQDRRHSFSWLFMTTVLSLVPSLAPTQAREGRMVGEELPPGYTFNLLCIIIISYNIYACCLFVCSSGLESVRERCWPESLGGNRALKINCTRRDAGLQSTCREYEQ